MGCTVSAEEAARRAADRAIEQEQRARADADSSSVKLLLLGAGESGKSTLFKQFRELYGKPLESNERQRFRASVYTNVLDFMRALCENALRMESEAHTAKRIGAPAEPPGPEDDGTSSPTAVADVAVCARRLRGNDGDGGAAAALLGQLEGVSPHEALAPALTSAIRAAWAGELVQSAWARRAEFQIIESSKEFVEGDALARLAAPDYVPTTADIMRCRMRTSGIVEERYAIDGVNFNLFDVGGQRNERKKWIHCFEGVTAVIFVAAISEYDQTLFEEDTVNRMVEALDLFEEICNIPYFADSSIILFLNKRDLFERKVRAVPIADQAPFSDFDGGDDYDAGVQYFTDKFLERNRDPDKQIFSHVTCALDADNVRVVFDSCKDTIMRQNLAQMGMM